MMAVLLAGILWILAQGKINDPDLWWHMRNAEHLLQTHHFPNQDTYSFTVAGVEWINHSWLAEIPYYLAWRGYGFPGVNLVWIGMVCLIFCSLLYRCWRASGNLKASIIACGFCSFLAVVNFGPRTILFGWACMMALLILLERFQARGRGGLWLIPPLFCLWINSHGSWMFGFLVFGIFIAGGLIEGKWGRLEAVRWTRSNLVKLAVTVAATIAAVFVNPFGWKLVQYPFDFGAKQTLNVAHIEEWASINFHDAHGKVVFGLLLCFLLAALLKNKQWRLTEAGCLVLGLYLGLTYARFLFFLGIIAAPMLAKFLDFIPPYDRKADKPALNVALMAFFGYFALHFFPHPSQTAFEKTSAQQFPAQALSYLKTHPLQGRVLNDFFWGGYLIWHDRDLKVFIDSRVDIFEYAGVFADYVDLLGVRNVDRIMEKYQIRYVLFPASRPLTYLLEHDPKWRVNYRDPVTVLFERTDLPNPAGP
jgi:hypothetical protein